MKIAIMGSTGSIGVQALEVVRNLNKFSEIKIEVFALSANENIEVLAEQINEFKPAFVSVGNKFLRDKVLTMGFKTEIFHGDAGLIKIAEMQGYDLFLNALMGNAGLLPTVSAIKTKKRIALANKETLVSAGEIIMNLAKENNVDIIPIDSEHSAIFQCLKSGEKKEVQSIILTASGGPFRLKTKKELESVTAEDALSHPTWNMGKKITIDSATLMNKGLEVIEAKWLFDMPIEKINVVVHPESIVHSAVEFIDGSVIAQLGAADMRIPIQYALTYPKRAIGDFKKLSLFDKTLAFEKPDMEKFPCLKLAIEAVKKGRLYPCIMNAANEVAVNAFLKGEISYLSIYSIIEKTLSSYNCTTGALSLENVLEADFWAREQVKNYI